jgi:iron complex outermembrane receptor protein
MTSLRTWLQWGVVWIVLAPCVNGAAPAATLAADIGPRPVAEALAAFGRQAGLQLIYVSAIAETLQSKGARAGSTVSEGLAQLLDGTGLRFEFLNARTVRIFPAPAVIATTVAASPLPAQATGRRTVSRGFGLEEVVVTATRREERADKVPISMVVWTQEAMEASGVKGMDEIGALTPGVEFDFDSIIGDGFTNMVIRGMTGTHGTTTGVFFGDTPVPTERGNTFARSFPWMFDLDRVEVLRGPQGTLLGQGTLGGAVRFIMKQPSLTTFSGLARAELSTTARGAGSYEAGVAAGGPVITDVLGFRASAWYRSDGGFVDRINPLTGATIDGNANRRSNKSVRLALTWAPTNSVRITPSLDYESFAIRDTSAFYPSLSDPAAGELRNGSLTRQPGKDALYLAAVKLDAALGEVNLSSVSSYFHRTGANRQDWSSGPDYADAATLGVDFKTRMFSQEARLTSADPGAAFTWIAGLFYSNVEKREASAVVPVLSPVEGANATVIDETQIEGFGQIGLRIAKRLTASAGLRTGRSKYDAVTEAPPIFRANAGETWVAPRYGLSYQFDEHNLLYLTVAKGYRSGGVYPAVPCGGPDVYPSDTVWSYELGAKNDLWGGRVHIEPSVFHIKWHDTDALFQGDCSFGGVPQGGVASNGFELSAQALVTAHLRAGLALAYTDAHYTQTVKVGDAVIVHNGDALLGYSGVLSPWNVTASLEYRVGPVNGITVTLRGEDVFHSRNPGPFIWDDPSSPFYFPGGWRVDPSVNALNLRASMRWPSFDLELFVNNALDTQPILGSQRPGGGDLNSFLATTFRPRTVGLSTTRRF